MKLSTLLAFTAAGIAIALFVRRLRGWSTRPIEEPETAAAPATPDPTGVTPTTSESPIVLSAAADPVALTASLAGDHQDIEKGTDARAIRDGNATFADVLADSGDEAIAPSDPDPIGVAPPTGEPPTLLSARADPVALPASLVGEHLDIEKGTGVVTTRDDKATFVVVLADRGDEAAASGDSGHPFGSGAPDPADHPAAGADVQPKRFIQDDASPIVAEPIAEPETPATSAAAAMPHEHAATLEIDGSNGFDEPAEIEPDSETPPSSTPTLRPPRQFRPPRSAPTGPGGRRTSPTVAPSANRERRLAIEVRLRFEHGGFCRLSLIPQKDERLDGEIMASSASGEIELVPLQDIFYSDVFPADIGSALLYGLEWTSAAGGLQMRWSLAGREVYVLGQDEHISGHLSMPRTLLHARHAVLCTDERAAQVLEIVTASGSPPPTVIGPAEGLPAGWMGFTGVTPTIPIPQSDEHDILNVLRPRPDISIALDGGIRIGRNTWLAEYPPQIHVRGDVPATTTVLIDGVGAARTHAGIYVAPGWDLVGEHTIWCADQSRTYEIRPGLEAWTGWDAYRWSLEGVGADGASAQPSLCGPLVRPPRAAAANRAARVISTRNPVLIGATPGEIVRASRRGTLRAREGLASVPFDPVWALPADPLHCNKTTARVIAVADRAPVDATTMPRSVGQQDLQARRAWCDAILDAARKGLAVEPDNPDALRRWAEYRRRAKALRRRLR